MSLKQNIIYLYFKGKHLITSKSQYQYNHGQYLYFADLNLPQAFEVHFSNKERGESKTQIGSNKLVEIPDEYFWNGALQIYAWIYLHSETTDGETIYEVRIPLIKRAKPTDEEPLPVQQSTIDKAIAELNNAVDITNENANKTNADKTQVATIKEEVVTLKEEIDSTASAVSQDAQSARESADASEQSAQNSAESERKALDYSDEAKGYAQSALESKDTASQKAQVATDASAETKDFRDEAETFKNEAEQAKQNIVDYRNETKGYRDETLTTKDDTQTIKGDVQSLKTQIDKTATDVEINASNAKSSADLSYQSAISADRASLSASQFADEASDFADSAGQSASQAEEFKNQSATNVTHYPKVIDGYWYVWDASKNEYVNTNVDARGVKGDKGDVGNGIENTVLNSDYTLTITFTDGTSYTTPSIRGEKGLKGDVGNGIASTVLNDDYTLTLTFTDGTTYTTPSIRGEKGEKGEPATDMEIHICSASEYDAETRVPTIANPNDKTFYLVPTEDGTSPDLFTEWVYVNNAWEMFGSAKIDLTDYVKNTDYATGAKAGVIKLNPNYGINVTEDGILYVNTAESKNAKMGTNNARPITPIIQHESIFYGLAKAAGHDEKDSELPVGQYTDEAKSSIQNMLDVPSNADLDEVEEKVEQNTEDLLKAFPVETANGNIASFEDGADGLPLQSLVVDINPVQDLNGYDSPWVGGGGKNLFDADTVYASYKQSDESFSMTGSQAVNAKFYIPSALVGQQLTFSAYLKIPTDSAITSIRVAARVGGSASSGNYVTSSDYARSSVTFTPTSTDDCVYVTYGSNGSGLLQLKDAQLEAASTATSYAPYENICPISGWTEVDVEQRGKNLFGGEVGATNTYIDASTGIATGATSTPEYRSSDYFDCRKFQGKTLTLNHGARGTSPGIAFYDINKNYISGLPNNSQTAGGSRTFSVPSNAHFLRFTTLVDYASLIQLELSSTATPYEPYTGRSITIDLGQTVYGGKLDVLSGVLTVDRAIVDLGTLNWTKYLDVTLPVYYALVGGMDKTRAKAICSHYPLNENWIALNAIPDKTAQTHPSLSYIYFRDDDYSDATAFKTAMLGVQLCYELAEPIEIQLSANQINSLYGVNNIWADTGDTALEYRADPDLYIQRKMPEVPVDDVQINGTSIVTDGVANVPVATDSVYGTVRVSTSAGNTGIYVDSGLLKVSGAVLSNTRYGSLENRPITPAVQHGAVFYGLAKAAGDTTQSQSSNAVGNYTDNAKDKIQTMLGVSPLIAPHESDPFESNHVVGELFIIGGKLYRAKTALTAGEYVNEGTNVEVVDIAEVLDSKVRDVQINGNSVAENGVANIPIGTLNNFGVLKVGSGLGVNQGLVTSNPAVSSDIKAATANYKQIVPSKQHESVFYGLAKASGDTTQSVSSNAVGTYTDEAKASIKSMLGVQDGMVVNATLVSGTQYTIDSTYDDIKSALSAGKTVVVMTEGVPQPYVGNIQLNNEWFLAFGVSTIYNNVATLTGFMIPETYQNVAIWTQQNTIIPTLNDVQINGTSVVMDGVANVPMADESNLGAVTVNSAYGIGRFGTNGALYINVPTSAYIKSGTNNYRPIVPKIQHEAVFYGLAKAAGYDEKNSTLSIGEYTEDAKSAISEMLGGSVSVSGTTPTIVAKSGIRYVCGEVLSLKFTPSTNGICDVMFTSGSTPTVLTLPNTVKMPEWFIIEANMTYEINIADGIYGAVTSWTL